MRYVKYALLLSTLALSVSACVYKIPVQQGNYLPPEKIQSVRVGQSINEVRENLGKPILKTIYANNQEIYIYTFQTGYHKMKGKQFIVYFDHGHVARTSLKDISSK